jgi:hypothetical protein
MTERLKYTDLSKPVNTMPFSVDVCVVRVRPADHPWVQEAHNSVHEQSYEHLGLLDLDNTDRELSIGAAWNACVRASTADLLLFLGDDDALTPDLVSCMVDGYIWMRKKAPNLIRVSTNCTVLDDDSKLSMVANGLHHTGMFQRAYLLDHPFDEELCHGVGKAMATSIDHSQRLLGQPLSVGIMHHAGYIYRQHMFMASGNPIRLHQE